MRSAALAIINFHERDFLSALSCLKRQNRERAYIHTIELRRFPWKWKRCLHVQHTLISPPLGP